MKTWVHFGQGAHRDTWSHRIRFAVLLGAAFVVVIGGRSAPAGTAQAFASEVENCKTNLNRLFEAIQEFRRIRHVWPDYLSDLHPEFVSDLNRFTCPEDLRNGKVNSGRRGLRTEVFEDVVPTGYSYELCPKKYQLWTGISSTDREYKLRQMQVVGSNVPIVRCLTHRPVVNLSIGGAMYESQYEWEYQFTNWVRLDELLPPKIFKEWAPKPGFPNPAIPARTPRTESRLIDLSNYFVTALHVPWLWRNPRGRDLSALPQGIVQFPSVPVPFDVRGLIQLGGKNLFAPFPERVDAIPVGQKCQQIHFLHGAIYPDPPGTEIGRYEVRFVDAVCVAIPVVYGRDVLAWDQAPTDAVAETSPSVERWRRFPESLAPPVLPTVVKPPSEHRNRFDRFCFNDDRGRAISYRYHSRPMMTELVITSDWGFLDRSI